MIPEGHWVTELVRVLETNGMKKADVEKRVAELLEQCGLEKEYAKKDILMR